MAGFAAVHGQAWDIHRLLQAAGEREVCHVQWRRQDFVTGGK